MNNLDKTIKHFRSLQKRYTKMHQGEPCERVSDALEALSFYKDIITGKAELVRKWRKYENETKV